LRFGRVFITEDRIAEATVANFFVVRLREPLELEQRAGMRQRWLQSAKRAKTKPAPFFREPTKPSPLRTASLSIPSGNTNWREGSAPSRGSFHRL
jgi:hypothetical protein